MINKRILFSFFLTASCTVCQPIFSPNALAASPTWYKDGQQAVASRIQQKINTRKANNVILFVGDGMGISTITAARIYQGQQQGQSGEENLLSFEKLPYSALVKTYNTNQQVPDSAGTATAMHSGIKTRAGVIGINEKPQRGNCKQSRTEHVKTIGEIAAAKGKSVGIVTTTRVTHATPATVYAHSPERNWEADNDLPKQAVNEGCLSISQQLLEQSAINVVLGGGKEKFTDKQIQHWKQQSANRQYITDSSELDDIDPDKSMQLLGLFADSHMSYMLDLEQDSESASQPTLTDMTTKALDILEKNRKGYFLMVEAGRIDHGHHQGQAGKALTETVEFSRAIATTLKRVNLDNTLVLVTADHSHVMTIAGYPTRGNPILGLVTGNNSEGEPQDEPALAIDNLPYTTLSYANGPGASPKPRKTPGTGESAYQQALVPTGYTMKNGIVYLSETHAGEDVSLYAAGPWAHLVSGVMEQHVIFHIMMQAYGFRD